MEVLVIAVLFKSLLFYKNNIYNRKKIEDVSTINKTN